MLDRREYIREGFTGKRCPKCRGNLFLERDLQGWYEGCLQCGYAFNLPDLLKTRTSCCRLPRVITFQN